MDMECRPWGGYQVLEEGEGFKVKRIWVYPGEVLSLQSHGHRAEHWVVVKGTGQVTIGETLKLCRENESAYIPAQVVHQMANLGNEMLEFIEIQKGNYLGEDDIVRYSDKYGRAAK
ncbi:MAG: phosphomannose isomerase type II C-terminal cupin domain [Candidatus Rifleibacteriota bacterium]